MPAARRPADSLRGSSMLWRGRRQSDNIEDARGQGGGGFPGGFGARCGPMRIPMGRGGGRRRHRHGIIILVIIFFGLNCLRHRSDADPRWRRRYRHQGGGGTVSETNPPANDEMKQFVATVLAETEDTWNGIFQAKGPEYQEPTLTLFSGRSTRPAACAPRLPGRSIAPAIARSISTPIFSTSSPISSAPRAISPRPMSSPMRSAITCRISPASCPNSTRSGSR